MQLVLIVCLDVSFSPQSRNRVWDFFTKSQRYICCITKKKKKEDEQIQGYPQIDHHFSSIGDSLW